jgi:short-subunit dehydrogenase
MAYALITGASKGIGKEIVYQLCEKKIDVLLVARSEDLLQELKNEVEEKYKVRAAYFAIDLSKTGAANEIFNWCKKNNYCINILVNNAGYGLSGAFEKYSLKEHEDMMQVNMNALVGLTRLFLPELKKQTQSYILNIASAAAYQSIPYLCLYAATKAFVVSFSRGLNYELKDTNVSVSCVCPGGTETDFGHRANIGEKAIKAGKKLNMQPEEVAKITVKSMFKKKKEITVGFVNKLGVFLAWLAPKILTESVAAKIYKD